MGSALAADASFTCTYQVSAAGAAHNVAEVTAIDQSNRPVSDQDETFVAAPVEVLGITLEQQAPVALEPAALAAELRRTGTQARDLALFAAGLAGLGLGVRRLSRRPKNAAA